MEEIEPQFTPEQPARDESSRQEALAFIWGTLKVVIISLAIIIPVRYFLVQPFFVNGASMEETFDDGDYILIDEITYRFQEPKRGEVVVFRFPQDTTQFFIKRIVGLPGETVEIKNDTVIIYDQENPEGLILDESIYLTPEQHSFGNLRIKLDPEEYFVMGDNRLQSSDSRRWGPVNRSLITGRVFLRAWPVDKFGLTIK
ncbi:MAG: signal peptidase I [Candidatus Paceibacterota bacterium]